MALSHLDNYLATHRKRSGLSQQEIAWLLGHRSGAEIALFEKNRRDPNLKTALGLEIIFGVPAAELFAGKQQRYEREIRGRLRKFHARVVATPAVAKGRRHRERETKLQWLADRLDPPAVELA
ncbi:MAG: helix-turn-helix transcriptional regulator [Terriglobales bacterium]